nr:hypothetical protein [Tanacetum cinerariifolium]
MNMEKETAAMGPPVNKRHRKRDQSAVEVNVPPKILRTDHASVRPTQGTRGRKSIAAMRMGPEPSSHTSVQQSVSYPDPISYAKPQPTPEQDIAHSYVRSRLKEYLLHINDQVTREYIPARVGRDQRLPPGYPKCVPGPGGTYIIAKEAKLLKKSVAQVAHQDQRIQARENKIKNLEALLEAEADMKKTTEAKNAELDQVTGEERIKAAFEEFKKYKDDRVEQRCAEMDAHLDKLSIDFNEDLYPHMLTAIAGRLSKGMSEGLKYGIEHGKASRNLADVEAYDLEANGKVTLGKMPLSRSVTFVQAPLPMIVPQGLVILLVDAATQTDIFKDGHL